MKSKNKRVLILSGPTHEYLDPVRYIGNSSSGKMGKALAEAALRRGLEVEFITGPVPEGNLPAVDAVPSPHPDRREKATRVLRLHIRRVISAEEMLAAARKKFADATVIIFAAAVADYRPAKQQKQKIERRGGLTLKLEPTPDIAASLCANKRPDQIAVGFALQTHNGKAKAREKLITKNLGGIILNTPAALGADSGHFTWLDAKHAESWGALSKTECAERIFDRITG